ncbi:MAG: N-succinylarginine dihydrolase [Zymomonas mobilis subsp. pomaceae]|uniref:N-succinylarginine dihydrolase n=1 Tax=Zymomonas mobilis subsp. pomaceae (strain ATCC 29192 / DSM 22645 / JCM 10191 / CCUG 17912 / NBRC 13757 / NCIMB 11200 / NRRL B-4491 / Barker I) TaxID=579138 RepID=F8ETM3_ZYMMT|nr:N-succinylarginine dihydrolase [Zymomonas mobilis]AEI37033.1 N-succinylarginine dihydrolase [Zymomonas mobilis subsp. pomaceae ATCC 29192]MDX5948405.1 N-succinylarginine dihydrolase [Zymomonas mobilis subsp. pomaceae]GEB89605.1 N-succinylarginine dihydrolase [Zymomonas mobilis subsp. pomaceae]
MIVAEVNFDGLIGPTHNYAGLSLGNKASTAHAGAPSYPRQAALQGLKKMKCLMDLGLTQGVFLPPLRPVTSLLHYLGYKGNDKEILTKAALEDRPLFNTLCSASAMWAANAATVIAASDSGDGRIHFITANLSTMLHRSLEAETTCQQLNRIFSDSCYFAVHRALPYGQHFSDEGAANHMRLTPSHKESGLNIFVYGEKGSGPYPERQNRRASQAVARLSSLPFDKNYFIPQKAEAIAKGAFHNDVVAVANEYVLLAHAEAFEDQDVWLDRMAQHVEGFIPLIIDSISLEQAIKSYLFNSQIVTLPDNQMAIILPREVKADPAVWQVVETIIKGNNPISQAIVVDVHESMANGGGPACLRLRVPLSKKALAAVDQRYILNEERWGQLCCLVEEFWPERLLPDDLINPDLWKTAVKAHWALINWLG